MAHHRLLRTDTVPSSKSLELLWLEKVCWRPPLSIWTVLCWKTVHTSAWIASWIRPVRCWLDVGACAFVLWSRLRFVSLERLAQSCHLGRFSAAARGQECRLSAASAVVFESLGTWPGARRGVFWRFDCCCREPLLELQCATRRTWTSYVPLPDLIRNPWSRSSPQKSLAAAVTPFPKVHCVKCAVQRAIARHYEALSANTGRARSLDLAWCPRLRRGWCSSLAAVRLLGVS